MAGLTGDFLILVFFGLGSTAAGTQDHVRGGAQRQLTGRGLSSGSGTRSCCFPPRCLLGYSLAPGLGPALVRLWAALNSLSRRKTVLGLVAIFLLAVAVARIGRIAVLYDLPFTDDEYAVEFGGHIMATGHVTAPRSLPVAAIPTLGLFLKDGYISRADWPGAQAVCGDRRADAARPLRVGPPRSAFPSLALGILMARRLGTGWGFVAGIVFLCSPMALMLSLTTHAHLASRAMLALAVAGYWFAETTWDPVGVGPDRARLRVGFPVSPARDRLLLRAAPAVGGGAERSRGAGLLPRSPGPRARRSRSRPPHARSRLRGDRTSARPPADDRFARRRGRDTLGPVRRQHGLQHVHAGHLVPRAPRHHSGRRRG